MAALLGAAGRAARGGGAAGPSPYEGPAREPFEARRGTPRTTRQMEIARENARLAKKLKSVKKAAPASFHAPNGTGSLARRGRPGSAPLTQRERDEAPRAAWPPQRGSAGRDRQKRFEEAVRSENRSLRRALADQYRPNRDSELLQKKMGRPVDGNALWMQRLSLYDDHPPARPAGANATEVPKTLGVAICSATGLKSFFAADGLKLKEHGEIPGIFYCDEFFDDFKQADAATQQNLLEYYRNGGRKQLQLVRGVENTWVTNGSAVMQRKLMRDRALGKNKLSGEEIRARYEAARRRERDSGLRGRMTAVQENCVKAALKQERKIIRDDFRL